MAATLTDLVRQIGVRVLGGDELHEFLAAIDGLDTPDVAAAPDAGATVPAPAVTTESSQGPSAGDPQPGQPI